MYKIVIDEMDTPERFDSVENACKSADEIFGVKLLFHTINGIPTAEFDGDIVIQIMKA